MSDYFKIILLGLFIIIAIFIGFLFIGSSPSAKKITWGVNFSQKHTQNLGLDWKETYLAFLDDWGVRRIKIAVQWDLIEPKKDEYNFDDLNWQILEAEKREAKVILVIGIKTGRWPECHIPEWARDLTKKEQQREILEMLEKIVLQHKDSEIILAWQVENEPFFPFGECPWTDKNFLKKEVKLVKSLDPQRRPIIISESGEGSTWFTAAKLGDIVGVTMYRKIWAKQIGIYVNYPFRPIFYWRKAQIIKKLFGKDVICIELQTEPWGPKLLYDVPIEEQKKSMDLMQFRKNIEFAKKTGLKEFYLWGGEWMYWLKKNKNQPEIWQEAKKLFNF